jgi:hypothetical protein
VSTVLWANVLVDGKVISDESDHLALYKHADKLDAIARTLRLRPFLEICDTTDQRYNLEDEELPEGMSSTNELMAAQGAWLPIAEAQSLLGSLREHIVAKRVRFGLLSNQHTQVVAELDEVLAFVAAQSGKADRFNFSVVM